MNDADRLTLRARQLLDDPTLSPNQRIDNAAVLLQALAASVRGDGRARDAVLASIVDVTVRANLDAALTALGA